MYENGKNSFHQKLSSWMASLGRDSFNVACRFYNARHQSSMLEHWPSAKETTNEKKKIVLVQRCVTTDHFQSSLKRGLVFLYLYIYIHVFPVRLGFWYNNSLLLPYKSFTGQNRRQREWIIWAWCVMVVVRQSPSSSFKKKKMDENSKQTM